MAKVFGYFDKVYVINLDSDAERMDAVKARLDRSNIPFHRISAVNKSTVVNPYQTNVHPGHLACALSHGLCYADAIANNHEAVIVLEDDVILRDDIQEVVTNEVVPQLVTFAWDMCYLGLKLGKGGEKVAPNLLQVIDGSHTHAYAVHKLALEPLHKWATGSEWHEYGYFDRFKVEGLIKYAALPMMAVQEPGFSSIGGDEINRMWEYFRDFPRDEFLGNCKEAAELDAAWHKRWNSQ